MERHDGHIVEYEVRKNGFNIRRLAKAANVSRRMIYNLFQQPNLKKMFILVVGQTIHHDFSNEFPELFTRDDFTSKTPNINFTVNIESILTEDSNLWKDKYIRLLEAYNLLLAK